MSGDIEAAGAAATAGLVAATLQKGEAHSAEGGVCANCGAEITGRYCSACGQVAHVHRSLLHLVEETLNGVFHFDTRMWRTLPRLAFRPGTLTRSYIEGQRTRFVSPLALFLFCIFIMFFAFSFNFTENAVQLEINDTHAAGAQSHLNEARAELAQDRAAAEAAGDTQEAAALSAVSNAVDHAATQVGDTKESAAPHEEGDEAFSIESLQREVDEKIAKGEMKFNTGDAKRDARLLHAAQNIELTLYKMKQAAYKFAFLLAPLSLPFIGMLFFWKRGVTFFDHAVFALYSLSFMSLFYVLGIIGLGLSQGAQPIAGLIGTSMALVPPVHIFFQLGGAYKLGWFSALWRTFFLVIMCFIVLALFATGIVMIGLLG